ncbi:hypothetical protein [Paludisphaera borealis]|nr:hypothetical protein [Paludisphaera borealis]
MKTKKSSALSRVAPVLGVGSTVSFFSSPGWEPPMQLRGIVMSAVLDENPPGSDRIELTLWLQGVGPGKPRRIVVPYDLLLSDPSLDAESVQGHGFEAEVEQDTGGRWVVAAIGFADGRVLRDPG